VGRNVRLLTVTNSYGANGAAAMLRNSARHWTRTLGWEVDAFATTPLSHDDRQLIVDAGMTPVGPEVELRSYDRVLINTLVDLPHIDRISPHVPVVVWAHEGATMLLNQAWSARQWMHRFEQASRIVFQSRWQSESVYRSFLYRLPPGRVLVVPNGVQPIDHPGRPDRGPHVPARVISVGSLVPRKRPMDLARACIELSGRRDISCRLVGNIDHFSTLGAEAERVLYDPGGPVQVEGEMHGVGLYDAIAGSDVLCHPSEDESYALAPLEAALLGVPVILADLECHNHVGWVHGENCLKFLPGDIRMLSGAIDRLLDDTALFRRLSESGRALARRHDWEEFLGRITSAILEG